jgi:putative PIN family toxin of toxin-antitoxin system
VKPKAVIDTNVFVSGIFFAGPPSRILRAWVDEKIQIAVSEEIIEEYKRVIDALSIKLRQVDIDSIFGLLLIEAELVQSYSLEETICKDPDDDKFLACAVASNSRYVISGDKHLLKVGRYFNTVIVTPRYFVDNIL